MQVIDFWNHLHICSNRVKGIVNSSLTLPWCSPKASLLLSFFLFRFWWQAFFKPLVDSSIQMKDILIAIEHQQVSSYKWPAVSIMKQWISTYLNYLPWKIRAYIFFNLFYFVIFKCLRLYIKFKPFNSAIGYIYCCNKTLAIHLWSVYFLVSFFWSYPGLSQAYKYWSILYFVLYFRIFYSQ